MRQAVWRATTFTIGFCICLGIAHGAISREAQQTILDVARELGLQKINTEPVPVHRLDRDEDYVAYYLVEADNDFMITSAGKQTEDRDLVVQGHLPSPKKELDDNARARRSACAKYYLLSPSGEMVCKDAGGTVVATNIMKDYVKRALSKGNYANVDELIKDKEAYHAKQWEVHAKSIRHVPDDAEIRQHEEEVNSADDDVIDLTAALNTRKRELEHHMTSFELKPINPGVLVKLSLGDPKNITMIVITYMQKGGESNEDAAAGQQNLCKALSNCETNDTVSSIDTRFIKTENGLSYLELLLDDDAKDIFGDKQVVFNVEDVRGNAVAYDNVYEVVYPPKSKRSKQYTSWSGTTYHSIAYWNTGMPDYYQFQYSGCSVGCGPVAWAQVFCYLDRRSHLYGYTSGSKGLYRSGSDGTTGSSNQVAPRYIYSGTTRVKNYIKKLNNIMGTFCLGSGGATFMSKMDNTKSFFQARQTTGNPQVYYKKTILSLLGIYQKDIASYVRAKLRDKWPVIIGWRYGAAWHYPVVARYRWKKRQYRICIFFICGKWKWTYDFDMYLKQGWGGSKNGWYELNAFYAVYCRY